MIEPRVSRSRPWPFFPAGNPAVPQPDDAVPAPELHRRHRGGVQAAELGKTQVVDVEQQPVVQRETVPEHRCAHVARTPEAGQRGGVALGTRVPDPAAVQEGPGAAVGRVPARFRGQRVRRRPRRNRADYNASYHNVRYLGRKYMQPTSKVTMFSCS